MSIHIKEKAVFYVQKKTGLLLDHEELADYLAFHFSVKAILMIVLSYLYTAIYGVLAFIIYAIFIFVSDRSSIGDMLEKVLLAGGALFFLVTLFLTFKEKLPFSKIGYDKKISANKMKTVCLVMIVAGFLHEPQSDIRHLVHFADVLSLFFMSTYIISYAAILRKINIQAATIALVAIISLYVV